MNIDWLTFALTAGLALGWSFFNGMHRRNSEYKRKVAESASRFPSFTRRKLLRLIAPTRFKDRVNHALVIAGCCLIIAFPAVLVALIGGWTVWWRVFLVSVMGSLAGAFVGEFIINAKGCGLDLKDFPNHPDEVDEPSQRA